MAKPNKTHDIKRKSIIDMEKIDKILESLYDRASSPVEAKEQLLLLFGVMQRSEQLIGFLKDYQKSCELMHVSKIDAKNFVDHWNPIN